MNPEFFKDGAEYLLQDADALSGMRFQQALEKRAYALAMGKIPQQLYGDFCENKLSSSYAMQLFCFNKYIISK